LTALNTSLDENGEVMKLAKGAFLPPVLDLFQCHIICAWIVVFEVLLVGNEDESFSGEVDNMALAAKSVRFGIVLNIKSAEKACESQV